MATDPAAPDHDPDPADELIPLALRRILAASLTGTAGMGLLLWVVGQLVAADPDPTPDPASFRVNLLLTGVIAMPLLAAILAWQTLRRIESIYRRAAFSMVAGFGTVIGGLAATPVHHALGQGGLLVFVAAAAIVATLCFRPAGRLR